MSTGVTRRSATHNVSYPRSSSARQNAPRPAAPLTAVPDLAPYEARLRPTGDLAVAFKTREAGVEQVIAAVRAAGVQIRDLRTEDPDLEDVFVSLTSSHAEKAA